MYRLNIGHRLFNTLTSVSVLYRQAQQINYAWDGQAAMAASNRERNFPNI